MDGAPPQLKPTQFTPMHGEYLELRLLIWFIKREGGKYGQWKKGWNPSCLVRVFKGERSESVIPMEISF